MLIHIMFKSLIIVLKLLFDWENFNNYNIEKKILGSQIMSRLTKLRY